MATNADPNVADDDRQVTEEDLRDLKYGSDDVETSQEEDETTDSNETDEDTEEAGEEDGQTDDQAEDEETEDDAETESDEEPSEFVKEFPNIKGETLDEYARGLETAYKNSTAEALRLKKLVEQGQQADQDTTGKVGDVDDKQQADLSDPINLYMKQKMDEEISAAYTDFAKQFDQVHDQHEYGRFTNTVAQLSQTILQTEQRLAPPRELYSKAAVILGWQPNDAVDSKDKLRIAVKNRTAVSRTSSASKGKVAKKSKVTDQMIAANRLMYPDKTDAQIREELEPYVQ